MNLFDDEPKVYTLDDPEWKIYSSILDEDTRLNPITNEVNRVFKRFDGDKNNQLEKKEMKKFINKFCPKEF